MTKCRRTLQCMLGLLLCSTPTWAQTSARPDRVGLTLPRCPELPFDGRQLSELVEVELRAVGIQKLPEPQAAGSHAEAANTAVVELGIRECRPDAGEVELSLLEPRSGARAQRTMPIGDVALELRPRAIAIGIVEMVNASWKEIAPPPADPPRAAAPASNTQDAALQPATSTPVERPLADDGRGAQARQTDEPRAGIGAALAAWSFPSRKTALLGPAAMLGVGAGHFRGSVGAHAAFGEVLTSSGSAHVRWVSGYVGAGLRSTSALSAMLEPRLYLGYGWANGDADRPGVTGLTEGRLIVAAVLAGGLRSELSDSWNLLADLELGATLRGVTFLSDADQAAGISGAILGAQVGLELAP